MYKFYLCQTSDMTRIGEFTKASSRQLVVALNRSGSFSCQVRCEDPLYTYMVPKATCIEAEKDGKTIWSGPIETINTNFPARTAQVNCIGWFELLKRRNIRDSGVATAAIVNPGAETGGGWSSVGGATFSPSYAGPPVNLPHSGSSMFQLYTTGGVNTSSFFQVLTADNIPKGATVTLTAWALRPATAGTLDNTVYMGIGTENDPDGNGGFGLESYVIVTFPANNTWYPISVSWVNTYDNTTSLSVTMNIAGDFVGRNVFFDDFVLTYDTLNFVDADIGEIAETLVDRVNAWDVCPVKRGVRQTAWPRTVRYAPFQNVGEEIQRMSDVENGYDFEIDPTSRQLNVFWPMKGTVKTSYDAPSVAYDRSGPTYAWRMADSSTTTTPNTHGPANAMANSTGAAYTASQPTLCSSDPGDFSKTKAMVSGSIFGVTTLTSDMDIQNTSYSISLQFKITSLPFTFMGLTYLNGIGSNAAVFADGRIEFYPGGGAETAITAAGIIAANTTYHVVLTYDHATKLGTIYVNGAAVAAITCSSSRSVASQMIYYFLPSGGTGFTLTVDEIAVWIGRTISTAEMAYLYQSLRLRTPVGGGETEAVRFGYGERGAQNVSGVNKIVDSRDMANWVVTQGKGSTGGSGALARNDASIATYGAHDEVTQISQIDSIELMASYANAEIAVRSTPRLLYEFQPLTYTPENSVPNAFFDYEVGDVVQFDALDEVTILDDQGNSTTVTVLDVSEQNVRIFGISVALDEQGTEKITLATSPGN